LLIGVAIFLPFFVDAGTFFIAVALLATIKGNFRPVHEQPREKVNFKVEIREGFTWLWNHTLLRPLAIILGCMNGVGTLVGVTFILFAQEVLGTSVFVFSILGTAGAIGGIVGGLLAPKISEKIGSGPALWIALIAGPLGYLIVGFTSSWQVVWVVTVFESFVAVLWNTITVSLRQSIIPTNLLGRVNSVYRFFAWGSIPIGMFLGGAVVSLIQNLATRDLALRAPYLLGAVLGLLIFIFAAPRLTTTALEKAKAEAAE
jgi:MFS family permease